MDRERILNEIRRAAQENGNGPLGIARFEELTGITVSVWRGRFWATWGEATKEAGIQAGRMNEAFDGDYLLKLLAQLTRKYGRFPTYPETQLARSNDRSFPDVGVFARFGGKNARIEALRRFAKDHPEFADLLQLLPEPPTQMNVSSEEQGDPITTDGFVYMLKLGKHYKVGKTLAVPRRHRQIALELPEKPDVVHTIRTDDPDGIEAYWHRRFEKKKTNGEWFLLDAGDVRAFKRRKFM